MTKHDASSLVKTSAPSSHGAYARTRLFRVLDRARRRRVVWMWAPAGSGKTTLLATYIARRKLATVFYRVDRNDIDVATVFHVLRDAWLRRRRARTAVPRFTAQVGDVRAFARRFFSAIAAELPVRSTIAFVFDDAQEVDDDAQLWHVLREGIEALPESVTLYVASRRPPPPLFARGVAHGDVMVLDFEAMRLRIDESRAMLRGLRRADVPAGVARVLHERCGGWAAGLTLLASPHVGAAGPSADPLDGIRRQRLFDYFATEVFAALRPEQQRIATRTAVLSTIDRDVAEAVVDDADRGALGRLLEDLPLIERLDHGWRYHPLFRDFLLVQAENQLGAAALADLRTRAARVLLEHGRGDEAFELARQGRDPDALRAVVLQLAPELLEQGRTRTLAEWTSAFTREQLAADHWLAFWRGQALLVTAPGEALESFMIAATSRDEACAALACAGALQATAFVGEDFSRMDPLLARLLALDPAILPDEIRAPVIVSVVVAIGFRRPGDADAVAFVRQAHELVRSAPDGPLRRSLAGMLVFHELFFGDPSAADNIVDDLLGGTTRASEPFAQLTVLLARGVRSWTRGEVDQAVAAVQEGLALSHETGIHVWDDQLYAIGAAATIGGEKRDATRAFLEPLAAAASRSRFAAGNAEFYLAWAGLVWDDLAGATLHGERAYRYAREIGSPFARMLTATLMARISAAAGSARAAGMYLEEAEEEATSNGLNRLPAVMARVVVARHAGDDDTEIAATRDLLAMTRRTGLKAYFVLSRGDLAQCAAVALRSHLEPAAARTLVEALALDPPPHARSLGRWPWRARVRTFGPFEVEVRSRVASDALAGGRRTRELLGLVIALGPGPVAQTRLCDELWPDADGDAMRARLDTTLLRVRRQLGTELTLTLSKGAVSFGSTHVFVDLFAAEDWLQRADGAFMRRDGDAAAEALHEALALIDGRLFDGLDGPAFTARRHKFEKRLARTLHRAAQVRTGAAGARLRSLLARAEELLVDASTS